MRYLKIESFEKGTIYDLLYRSFEPLMNLKLESRLEHYDQEVFDNPETVGTCLFLTQFGGELIGMASWDPRQFPKAIIGYNCVLPKFQRKGFGKEQLMEILRRLREMGFAEALATTGDHPFYLSSQKMYKNCGFKEIQCHKVSSDPRYGSIDYHIVL